MHCDVGMLLHRNSVPTVGFGDFDWFLHRNPAMRWSAGATDDQTLTLSPVAVWMWMGLSRSQKNSMEVGTRRPLLPLIPSRMMLTLFEDLGMPAQVCICCRCDFHHSIMHLGMRDGGTAAATIGELSC